MLAVHTMARSGLWLHGWVRCAHWLGVVCSLGLLVCTHAQGPLFNMPGVHVDGMDVLKVREALSGSTSGGMWERCVGVGGTAGLWARTLPLHARTQVLLLHVRPGRARMCA